MCGKKKIHTTTNLHRSGQMEMPKKWNLTWAERSKAKPDRLNEIKFYRFGNILFVLIIIRAIMPYIQYLPIYLIL